jgi:molybdate transport system substrate-binding protein
MIPLLTFVCLAALSPGPAPLTVSAAVSLTDALEAVARAYAKSGGGEVRFNFAGSNTLARQLVKGAPADVFVSADERQMDVTAQAGAIDPASRVDLLGNRLAIVSRPGIGAIKAPHDLTGPAVKRIALGDPAAVPAGVYARRYLESTGVWSILADRVVPVANVRAALAAVLNGSADAAIVYESDTVVGSSLSVFVIDGPDAPRIVYPAAIASRTTNRAAAERFLVFLRGPEAAALFERYRFQPLAARR